MTATLTAQMSTHHGAWRVYVVLYGKPEWPEHDWARTAPVPTPPERAEALAALGYEVPDDAEWEWQEFSEVTGEPASPVRLLAVVTVRRKEAP